MGGVKVIEDIAIDKSIHTSVNSRSSVLKVRQKESVSLDLPKLRVLNTSLNKAISFSFLTAQEIDIPEKM